MEKTFWLFGALFAFLAVAGGAFGSHVLKNKLSTDYLHIFEIGIRYQMYHALALLFLALALRFYPSSWLVYSGWFFILGIGIFSGSLYALVLTGIKKWGAVTPIGGTLLLIGWLLALVGGLLA